MMRSALITVLTLHFGYQIRCSNVHLIKCCDISVQPKTKQARCSRFRMENKSTRDIPYVHTCYITGAICNQTESFLNKCESKKLGSIQVLKVLDERCAALLIYPCCLSLSRCGSVSVSVPVDVTVHAFIQPRGLCYVDVFSVSDFV